MKVDYVPFVDRMISKYEGGFGWNKKDPGGPTKYGITCYDLAEHRGVKMTSMATWAPLVQAMTLAEAEAIFATKYATWVRFDELPPGIDVVMFDYAVNSGPARAILVAKKILGAKNDAAMFDAIKKCNVEKFISEMCGERLRFMHAIRGGSAWAEFGAGWLARVMDLKSYAYFLSNNAVTAAPTAPDLTHVTTPKAINVPRTAGTATAGSAVTAATTAHLSGAPIWGSFAIAAAVVVAGITFEAYQSHSAEAANALVHA